MRVRPQEQGVCGPLRSHTKLFPPLLGSRPFLAPLQRHAVPLYPAQRGRGAVGVFTRQLCGSTGAGGRGDESSHRWEFVPQAEAEDRKPLRARDLSPQPGPYLFLVPAGRCAGAPSDIRSRAR
jgi:hypothetical protein